jgi:hypothetical protein
MPELPLANSFQMNRLFFGDNLGWLRDTKEFPDASVDLVYLDPPFNSNADYNVLFREASGEASQAQFRAFTDTWTWADAAESVNQSATIDANSKRPPETKATFLLHDETLARKPVATTRAILLVEERVVVLGGVERRVQIDEVHRFVLQIPPQDVEIVAVVERAHAPSAGGLLRGINAGVCPPVRFALPSLFCSDTLTVGY